MNLNVKNIYTSIGVNKTVGSLDWGANGLICYAAGNSVAILDPAVSNKSVKFGRKLIFYFSSTKHLAKS